MLSSHQPLSTLHPAFEDGTDRRFRNVGKSQSDAGEIPKRTHTIFKTQRKFEIKNTSLNCSEIAPSTLFLLLLLLTIINMMMMMKTLTSSSSSLSSSSSSLLSSFQDNNAANNIVSSSWCTMEGLCGVRFSRQ
jgi:hypothetical protein